LIRGARNPVECTGDAAVRISGSREHAGREHVNTGWAGEFRDRRDVNSGIGA
jgi:hypothetical protein